MHLRKILPVLVLVAAVAAFMALRATRPAAPPVEPRERSWRIETVPAEPAEIRPTLVLYGRIEAPDRMRAAAPVGGRLLDLHVRDGDRVRKGEVLARLDPRDLEPRVVQARADLERERIRHRTDRQALVQERTLVELAQAKRDRLATLKNARLGAASALDQAREDVARASLALAQREQSIAEHPARLAQFEARLAEAERDARRGEIRAPFDARVAGVKVAPGDQLQPGQEMLSLYPSDELFLRARVPVLYAEELRRALAAGARLEAQAQFGTQTLRAVLERIGGEADARGVDALLRLTEPAGVPAGAFVSAVLERPPQAGVIALPFSALHGGDRIYAVRDGRIESLAVERVGERREAERVLLLVRSAALRAGEQVMATHLPNAIDGLAVELVRP